MTKFEKGKAFTLTRLNGNYHIRYIFKPADENCCDFEYYEWVDEGELDDGWQKEWNAAQPIGEILDKPQNDSSIGVNYSKQYGKVSCTLSLIWVQPNEPNQLNAKEECFGSLR